MAEEQRPTEFAENLDTIIEDCILRPSEPNAGTLLRLQRDRFQEDINRAELRLRINLQNAPLAGRPIPEIREQIKDMVSGFQSWEAEKVGIMIATNSPVIADWADKDKRYFFDEALRAEIAGHDALIAFIDQERLYHGLNYSDRDGAIEERTHYQGLLDRLRQPAPQGQPVGMRR